MRDGWQGGVLNINNGGYEFSGVGSESIEEFTFDPTNVPEPKVYVPPGSQSLTTIITIICEVIANARIGITQDLTPLFLSADNIVASIVFIIHLFVADLRWLLAI